MPDTMNHLQMRLIPTIIVLLRIDADISYLIHHFIARYFSRMHINEYYQHLLLFMYASMGKYRGYLYLLTGYFISRSFLSSYYSFISQSYMYFFASVVWKLDNISSEKSYYICHNIMLPLTSAGVKTIAINVCEVHH